jgi:hypothetical protein
VYLLLTSPRHCLQTMHMCVCDPQTRTNPLHVCLHALHDALLLPISNENSCNCQLQAQGTLKMLKTPISFTCTIQQV